MNCLDCSPIPRDAVAVCTHCGTGICAEHAVVVKHHLTKAVSLTREVPVEPAARLIRCTTCHAAALAAGTTAKAGSR